MHSLEAMHAAENNSKRFDLMNKDIINYAFGTAFYQFIVPGGQQSIFVLHGTPRIVRMKLFVLNNQRVAQK